VFWMSEFAFDHLREQVLMLLHREAMTCRDVEDVVRFIRIFQQTMLQQMAEEQAAADAGKRGYSHDDVLGWEARLKTRLPLFGGREERSRVMHGYRPAGRAYRLTLVNDVVTEVRASAAI
jgi:hypothetical protein